jgi:hypothetical protein
VLVLRPDRRRVHLQPNDKGHGQGHQAGQAAAAEKAVSAGWVLAAIALGLAVASVEPTQAPAPPPAVTQDSGPNPGPPGSKG